jgi:hypothetical protein
MSQMWSICKGDRLHSQRDCDRPAFFCEIGDRIQTNQDRVSRLSYANQPGCSKLKLKNNQPIRIQRKHFIKMAQGRVELPTLGL